MDSEGKVMNSFSYISVNNLKKMDIQARKLELIKIITDIKNELLLERLKQYLNLAWKEGASHEEKTLSNEIADVILKINTVLPEAIVLRYNELIQKSVNKVLSEKEHQEYLKLIPTIENKTAERLGHLVELSVLWGCSVEETMKKLGIKTPPPIHS